MSALPPSVAAPVKVRVAPSTPIWFGPALATGFTLFTVIVAVSAPGAPSSSVTVRVAV